MTVRLYDTRQQALRDFVPLDSSNVTMYVCGPTVQSEPGIHHVRAAVAFDVLRRWLTHRFGRVTLVRNVTDIDDKILANATPTEPWWALAYRVEREFNAAYATVGVLAPTYEPRATGSIPQMLDLIADLIDRGHAYAADDGSGDVYFDVRSWPEYGSLTNQGLDALEGEASTDAEARAKRDPHDFALWKGTKPGEPADASWQSPWGAGRPGWHIECSAMAARYLGESFDLHGGGRDLRFPHHENELAQSSAAGQEFARYWVHNGLVNVGDQKMSKSLGNYFSAQDILKAHDPLVVRYALVAPHYRSDVELGEKVWQEAESALGRIRSFIARAGANDVAPIVPEAFATALDDDLATPAAFAVLHETVRRGNTALDAGQADVAATALAELAGMLHVLGFDELFEAKAADNTAAVDALVQNLIAERNQARAEKDWARADSIRQTLTAAGITLKDAGETTTWSFDG